MKLEKLERTLRDSRSLYPDADLSPSQVQRLFVQDRLIDGLNDIRECLKEQVNSSGDPAISDHEIARERLTLVAEAWLDMEQKQEFYKCAKSAFEHAAKLQDAYREACDEVLSGIYDNVSIEFSMLYRQLHSPDEGEFTGHLYQGDAGDYLEVDFHDRGRFPANALHSEGHQDSMGLCFFLVLAARLSGNDLQFVLLDDVVSSVDEGHRRELASLLTSHQVDRQVIVTTHDPFWSEMLSRVGFAEPSNCIRIDRWDINVGMIHSDISPIWDLIEDFLEKPRVVAAASELRRYAELLLKEICDGLRAPVPFQLDGHVYLHDVLGPGFSRFKKLLSRAKRKAEHNGSTELVKDLTQLEAARSRAFNELKTDGWLLNRIIHDNSGNMPTPDEIRRTLKALRELYDIVHCNSCHQMLRFSQLDDVISCKCGRVLWKT